MPRKTSNKPAEKAPAKNVRIEQEEADFLLGILGQIQGPLADENAIRTAETIQGLIKKLTPVAKPLASASKR